MVRRQSLTSLRFRRAGQDILTCRKGTPLGVALWLVILLLTSACTTTEKVIEQAGAVADVSPWKKTGPAASGADSDRNPPATIDKPAPRAEYVGQALSPTLKPQALPGDERDYSREGLGEHPGEQYELNFRDADIRGVIDAVLGDMLKLDYVIAPTVQGRITFRTSRPVEKTSLLPALEAALSTVSAAIIKSDGAVQVVPIAETAQRTHGAQRVTNRASPAPGFAIEILPLRYIDANEMKAILESFVPRGTILQADTDHQHLLIAGSSQDRAAVIRTVDNFDVDWLHGMTFAIYRLEQSRPDIIIEELRNIFRGPQDLFSNRVRLVPLERMQSVLGIARSRADLELISQWVDRLDVSKIGDRKMFVYNVQNSNAKELVSALRQVLTNEAPSALENPVAADGVSSPGHHSESESTSNIARLVAIEENNSLLFYGTDKEYQVIQDALRQTDVLPRQVMIEAIVAEVTLNDNLRYGVQWFLESGDNTLTLSTAESGSVSSQFPGFSYVYSGSADARVVLNALQSKTEVRILSAPKLSVLNNQKASLQVGDQVPIVSQTSQSTDSAGSPLVSTIEMRDTGVILEVTPRINENGNLILDVMQEVSEVARTTSSGIDSPTIQRRKIHSVVATHDGFTVALGGMIRENGVRIDSGIPLLKDIPFVGNLFKDNAIDSRRTELVILLVPHVMRNQRETQAVVDALVDGLEAASRLAEHARPLEPIK